MRVATILSGIFGWLLFLFPVEKISAQVVYTDVDPDVTINTFQQGFQIDFNHDGKIDVHLVLLSNVGVWTMQLIPDTNTDYTYVVVDDDEASILESGDEISGTSNFWRLGSGWGGLLYGYWNDSGAFGHWTGRRENKYLGIKFQINGAFHYAWIYLTTEIFSHSSMEFRMQAYAYNAAAEAPITAGDTAAVQTLSRNSIRLYPNPASDFIGFQANTDIQQVDIYDLSGKQIWSQPHFDIEDQIDISNFSKGLYIVKISSPKGIALLRLVKK